MELTHYSLYASDGKVYVERDDFEMTFDNEQEAVKYIIENFQGTFRVVCHDYGMGITTVKVDGKVVDHMVDAEYGEYDDDCLELWGLLDKSEQEEDSEHEVSCSACGDGGCVHCEPSRFIDGYIY